MVRRGRGSPQGRTDRGVRPAHARSRLRHACTKSRDRLASSQSVGPAAPQNPRGLVRRAVDGEEATKAAWAGELAQPGRARCRSSPVELTPHGAILVRDAERPERDRRARPLRFAPPRALSTPCAAQGAGRSDTGYGNENRATTHRWVVALFWMTPARTYFRLSTIIGSGCLTSVFGMGTGISSQIWAPGIRFVVKPIDWLVPVR
jgi:hypothetical protein